MMNLNTTLADVRKASRTLLRLTHKDIDNMLCALADATVRQAAFILDANRKDLARMNPEDPKYDRLKLTEARLQDIAEGLRQVASLPSPLGRTLKRRTLPNGLRIRRVSVPFGVIGIIYEARPNVSFDVFALCIKAGSACILKGGSDAEYSNRAIVEVIHGVLGQCGMDSHLVELLPVGHDAADCLLHARGLVDLIIPRGGRGLIDFVRQNATVPVIETGAGVCHAYFDRYADLEKGRAIVCNAKTRRVSVCNALDCLLIDAGRLSDLPALCSPLKDRQVVIYADPSGLSESDLDVPFVRGGNLGRGFQSADAREDETVCLHCPSGDKFQCSRPAAQCEIAFHPKSSGICEGGGEFVCLCLVHGNGRKYASVDLVATRTRIRIFGRRISPR